jgi:hypothetical protein
MAAKDCRLMRQGTRSRQAVFLACLLAALPVACDRDDVESWLKPDPTASGSLFRDKPLSHAVAALKKRLGGQVQALSLLFYEDRLVLQAQNVERPDQVDQYVFRGGRIEGPVPVKLLGKGKLEDNLFPLDAAHLEQVPRFVVSALEQAEVPEGKVTRVLLKRNLPESMDIQFRAFVTNQRLDAVVDADKDGKVLP